MKKPQLVECRTFLRIERTYQLPKPLSHKLMYTKHLYKKSCKLIHEKLIIMPFNANRTSVSQVFYMRTRVKRIEKGIRKMMSQKIISQLKKIHKYSPFFG